MEEEGLITSRPYGRVQIVKTERKRFGKERQEIFCAHLAATCNVARAAEAAGVSVQCVYQRRMKDPAFREAWARALEQGYARLEAMLLERAVGAEPVTVRGDLEPPAEPFDRDLAIHLLREHKKGLAGAPHGGTPPQRTAQWPEVEAYFTARLKALKVRIDRERAA